MDYFEGNTLTIPFDIIQHVERPLAEQVRRTNAILIITKHTRWNHIEDTWANNAYLEGAESDRFMVEWKQYLINKAK